MAKNKNDDDNRRCWYLFGLPLSLTEKCANTWQGERTDRTDIRQDGQTERTDLRQSGQTDRTRLRCRDGECGPEATIGAIGDSVGSALGGLSSGALGPLPLLVGGAAVVVAGAYAIRIVRQ